jgi:thiamine biosynthesis lipoprotein
VNLAHQEEESVSVSVHGRAGHFVGRFDAMASPCELLLASQDKALAYRLTHLAAHEAKRIERKFSRYLADSAVQRINRAEGRPVEVDTETANLLDYAAHCHALSDGRFDVTSGVLRRAWRFDGSDRLPSPESVAALLGHVGWQRVLWQRPWITLPPGMEIDLGGIGKEYAVDSTAALVRQHTDAPFVLNFGGDLYVSAPRPEGPWQIAVEDPRADGAVVRTLAINRGGLATSGDARRFLLKEGVRYGHILDPRTGWPVPDAPRSVTVLADTCLEAGMLATFAILHGAGAEAFLREQEVQFWIV